MAVGKLLSILRYQISIILLRSDCNVLNKCHKHDHLKQQCDAKKQYKATALVHFNTIADNDFAKRIYRLKLNNASFTAIACKRLNSFVK